MHSIYTIPMVLFAMCCSQLPVPFNIKWIAMEIYFENEKWHSNKYPADEMFKMFTFKRTRTNAVTRTFIRSVCVCLPHQITCYVCNKMFNGNMKQKETLTYLCYLFAWLLFFSYSFRVFILFLCVLNCFFFSHHSFIWHSPSPFNEFKICNFKIEFEIVGCAHICSTFYRVVNRLIDNFSLFFFLLLLSILILYTFKSSMEYTYNMEIKCMELWICFTHFFLFVFSSNPLATYCIC